MLSSNSQGEPLHKQLRQQQKQNGGSWGERKHKQQQKPNSGGKVKPSHQVQDQQLKIKLKKNNNGKIKKAPSWTSGSAGHKKFNRSCLLLHLVAAHVEGGWFEKLQPIPGGEFQNLKF